MRRRILPLISLSFAALLLSRAAIVSSEVVNPKVEGAAAVSMDQDAKQNPQAEPSNTQCLTGAILETLSMDMKRLDTRRTEISEREIALAAIETKIEAQMKAVEKVNNALQVKIDHIKSLANEDLKHLVSMYQTMKPKQAAEIFNSMDPAFAAGFLREMNSEKAGLIMANMDARKSYSISILIAGQNSKYRKKSNTR